MLPFQLFRCWAKQYSWATCKRSDTLSSYRNNNFPLQSSILLLNNCFCIPVLFFFLPPSFLWKLATINPWLHALDFSCVSWAFELWKALNNDSANHSKVQRQLCWKKPNNFTEPSCGCCYECSTGMITKNKLSFSVDALKLNRFRPKAICTLFSQMNVCHFCYVCAFFMFVFALVKGLRVRNAYFNTLHHKICTS